MFFLEKLDETQWKVYLLSIFHFRYWQKTLKNEVLKQDPINILGISWDFFYSVLRPPAWEFWHLTVRN